MKSKKTITTKAKVKRISKTLVKDSNGFHLETTTYYQSGRSRSKKQPIDFKTFLKLAGKKESEWVI